MTIKYDDTISIANVVRRISKHQCICCLKDLNKDIGVGKWHIPLCSECRNKFLEEEH